jgi:hypothetical protein
MLFIVGGDHNLDRLAMAAQCVCHALGLRDSGRARAARHG